MIAQRPSHLMVDIETMGVRPTSEILSLGAVIFNPTSPEQDHYPQHFYREINPESLGPPFTQDPETVAWWAKQKRIPPAGTDSIETVLLAFSLFISEQSQRITHFWANSPSSDFVILRHAYRVIESEPPFTYWQERDVRTLVEVLTPNTRIPAQHHALLDCFQQVQRVKAAYATII